MAASWKGAGGLSLSLQWILAMAAHKGSGAIAQPIRHPAGGGGWEACIYVGEGWVEGVGWGGE